jgi:hypothetical protein
MDARRLCRILVGFLMLHLTFVGADIQCAHHAGGPMQSSMHAMAQTGSAIESSTFAPASDQPCETPTQPDCCRAMTSCAVNLAFSRGTRLAELPPIRHAIAAAVMRVPASLVTPPDPPPPKA